jgi:hypothetical protein
LRDESFSSSVMMSLVRRIFTIGKKYFSNWWIGKKENLFSNWRIGKNK